METFLLWVPFLSPEHASCLSPGAPKAGKGAAALVLQVASCPALANTTLDPLLLVGRWRTGSWQWAVLPVRLQNNEGEFSPKPSPCGGHPLQILVSVCWTVVGDLPPVVIQLRCVCPSSCTSSLAGKVHARPACACGPAVTLWQLVSLNGRSKCPGGSELLNTMRITICPGSSTRPPLLAHVSVLTGTDHLD